MGCQPGRQLASWHHRPCQSRYNLSSKPALRRLAAFEFRVGMPIRHCTLNLANKYVLYIVSTAALKPEQLWRDYQLLSWECKDHHASGYGSQVAGHHLDNYAVDLPFVWSRNFDHPHICGAMFLHGMIAESTVPVQLTSGSGPISVECFLWHLQ